MGGDAFKRVYLKGVQQGQQLSYGAFLGSQDDYLIHALEVNLLQQARTISQNEPPILVIVDPIDDDAFWVLSSWEDFPFMSEMIADVTDISGVAGSGDFWSLTAYRGTISVIGE